MANEVEHLQVDIDVHDTQFIPGDKLLIDAFNEAKSGEANDSSTTRLGGHGQACAVDGNPARHE